MSDDATTGEGASASETAVGPPPWRIHQGRLIAAAACLARRSFTPDLDGFRVARELRRRIGELGDQQARLCITIRESGDALAAEVVALGAKLADTTALLAEQYGDNECQADLLADAKRTRGGLEDELERANALLRSLERADTWPGSERPRCPKCWRSTGHTATCELGFYLAAHLPAAPVAGTSEGETREPPTADVVDLMRALRDSMARTGERE